ncbi:MAG: ABC transporter ATP-binding protein [Clostridia bacterium]|nr:ABC transporter ATP-binding protein [Clostridia bacterium]
MKKVLSYFKGYKLECILGPLFKLFEATLELIVPLLIARIIDEGITLCDPVMIVRDCLWLLALGVVGLVFSITAQYFCARAAVGGITKMRSALFTHLGSLSYTEIDKLGTSTMITRITADANQVQSGVNLALRLLLRSPFVVFGAMIMACLINVTATGTIDYEISGIFGLTILVLSVIVFGIMLITMPLYKKVQGRLDGVVRKTRENLGGARVIRAFCKEGDECREFESRNSNLTATQKLVGRISALMNPLTYIVINVAIVLLIYTGAIKVSTGELSAGQVVALYNYMSQILVELIKLASLIITITKSFASASRISDVFDVKSSMVEGERECGIGAEYIVELEGATLTYASAQQPSIEDVSIKVRRGETVGIIGGTGAGKTSLINLIPRFYDATAGSVKIDGVDVREYTYRALRSRIGIVPQKATLFRGTVRDNLMIGAPCATDEDMLYALEVAQALDFVDEKGGLDAMIEEGGKNLSGGQRQRLTIARALASRPEILILDDSASALDLATDAALRRALCEKTDATVFIVSQRTASIMHADAIIVLEDGRCESLGTHDELLSSSTVYREIYLSQFAEEVAK